MAGPPLPSRLASPGPARAPRPFRTNHSGQGGSANVFTQTDTQDILLCQELLTQSSQSCRSNQLHQLVVGHVPQQVLQPTLPSEGRQLMPATANAAWGPRDRRVVQVLVDLATELLVLVALRLL